MHAQCAGFVQSWGKGWTVAGGDRFFVSLRVFNAGSIEKEDRPLQWNASVPSKKNGVGGDRFFWSPRVFNAGPIEKEDRPLQRNASVPSEKMA
jgi:hypothetical protein